MKQILYKIHKEIKNLDMPILDKLYFYSEIETKISEAGPHTKQVILENLLQKLQDRIKKGTSNYPIYNEPFVRVELKRIDKIINN